MVLASGVNFGLPRTVPHILGIVGGFSVLLSAVGLGPRRSLKAFPAFDLALKIAGGAYLLYLAWRIATTRSMSAGDDGATRPMTFMQAAAFQWVNPKAWVLALTAIAVYSVPGKPVLSIAIVFATFLVIMLPSLAMWTAFGRGLRHWLSDPARLKWFNIAMGIALAATLWPMLS